MNSTLARPIAGAERATKAHRHGRVCAEDRCATILSIYNDGRFCSLHAPMVVPRTRGVKIAG